MEETVSHRSLEKVRWILMWEQTGIKSIVLSVSGELSWKLCGKKQDRVLEYELEYVLGGKEMTRII